MKLAHIKNTRNKLNEELKYYHYSTRFTCFTFQLKVLLNDKLTKVRLLKALKDNIGIIT